MMNALLQPIRSAARIGFVILAWRIVALVIVQVFHAGSAVLVSAGDWSAHTNTSHMIGLNIMILFVLSIIGWMPVRFILLSLGLYLLNMLQYVFLYLPGEVGLTALKALHPVNALLIFVTAWLAARRSWQVVTDGWQPGALIRRAALTGAVAIVGLGAVTGGLRSAVWAQEQTSGTKAASLAAATEAMVPEPYRVMESPHADAAAVAAGRQIAEQRCIGCHAADFRGKQLGSNRSADLTQSAVSRSDQFLMWAISEGSQKGMPALGASLSEEERWQLVVFIKNLRQ